MPSPKLTPRDRAIQLMKDFRTELIGGGDPDLVEMLVVAISEYKEDLELSTAESCIAHPTYKGVRKPRTSCEACWRYYIHQKDSVE